MVSGYKLTSNYNLTAARVQIYHPATFSHKSRNTAKKSILMAVMGYFDACPTSQDGGGYPGCLNCGSNGCSQSNTTYGCYCCTQCK